MITKLPVDAWIGAVVVLLGVFLLAVLIPAGVTSPANVRIAVLSPMIWPNILSVILILIGSIMVLRGSMAADTVVHAENGDAPGWQGWLRIVVAGALMVALFVSLPILGMPLATSFLLLAYAILVQTKYPIAATLTAIILPLMIFMFFSKVAGVPIPQGQLVRLP